MNSRTVTAKVLAALKRGERLSQIDAFNRFRTTRLAAIIWNLRKAGHDISAEIIQNGGTRYAIYSLDK